MDLNKLSTADKVIAASGILLFIFSFFSWFAVDVGFGVRAISANGWDVGFLWGGIPALLGLLLAGLVLVPLFSADVKLPDLPVTWGQAILGAAALAAFLVVLRLLMGFHSWDRQIGLFLATAAAIGLAVGGFLKFQEEKAGATAAPPSAF